MKITLRELIEKKGWTEFRINTRLRTSDSYIFCDAISYGDKEIQLLLDKVVYGYNDSYGIITYSIRD